MIGGRRQRTGWSPPARSPAVVVLRALGLGDLLVVVPALRAVRRHWPDRPVVLATAPEPAPIAEPTGAAEPDPALLGVTVDDVVAAAHARLGG